MPLTKGTRVGEYEVVRQLGSGAMGEVYEAVHPAIGKRVAIKVMRNTAAEAEVEAKRLLEEARVVNAIRHPAIVDIFGANVLPDGRPYLVMELLEGESLQEYLRRNHPLAIADVYWLLGGLLEALAAAHKVGVVHRDLKPTNVFISVGPDGRRVKLLDFGVAHRANRERFTSPEFTVGSLGFMSPEQLGGTVLLQSDCYAVGCVAWLLLVDQPVFKYGNMADLALNHLKTVPPSVKTLRTDAPEPLARWVASLLQKDAARRPSNAFEALVSLKLAQDEDVDSTVVEPDASGDDDDERTVALAPKKPPEPKKPVEPTEPEGHALEDDDDESTVLVMDPKKR